MIVKLALQCVESEGVHRPTMSTICQELRTLSMEIDRGSTSREEPLDIAKKFAQEIEGLGHNESMTSKTMDSELALLKANVNMVMETTMDNTISLGKLTSQMDNMTSLFTQILENQKKSKANDIPNMDHVVAHSTSDNSSNTSMP